MKVIYIIAIVAIVAVAGCKKELNKEPIGLITSNQDETDPKLGTVVSSVTSSYKMLASTLNIIGQWGWDDGTVLRNDFILQDIASGDMQKKWNPDGDQAWMDEFSKFNFTASNGGFNGVWSYDFEGVSRCNRAIAYLTDATVIAKVGIDEASKNKLLAQSYFLRAFYYFDLVNSFGDVPLITKPLKNFAEAYDVATRVPQAQIWEQISADLALAKPLLPSSKYSDNTEKWRVSKGAVIALQAKVALYNKKWQEVIADINELEALGFYSLNTNYFDNFSVAKEFNDNEVIFAYDHQSAKTPAMGNGLCALAGWGFIAPTTNFIVSFEANDPRLGYTVDVQTQNAYKIFGELNSSNKGNEDSPSNKIFIRWADVILWKAEALLETGDYPAAITIINSIRTRARNTVTADGTITPAGTLPNRNVSSTDKTQIKDWLVKERRAELGFESQRFNDLKRWGLAKDFLKSLGINFQDRNYIYPIPQGEIDKSGGTIAQNPNY
ncbi:RagB/SusD family nutrient uptake outer membrane protein [Arcticibacter eurypsychrophilus]|uniref:RagB/SusD family nutrient uptake outer membrane protein n=1 Tax=Arcticibacter eurypsychrophilus TaxID=1434752 RepID=UPI00084D6099|nr:RagB/SusD family nutrient uptake outer membrane protein [Arcticibacter eurypsychrophilus]